MPSGRPARILVEVDEPALRGILTRALRAAGYDVRCMEDVEGRAHARFDLLVTNISVAELQRRFPGPPILHLDQLATPYDPAPDDMLHLYTPFSLDGLLEEATRLLEGRMGSRRSEPLAASYTPGVGYSRMPQDDSSRRPLRGRLRDPECRLELLRVCRDVRRESADLRQESQALRARLHQLMEERVRLFHLL
jgi:hypothetical protein